ncbi:MULTISPECIES: hypothetical protein [unclassified Bradyrhizobium]|uniref:hypothetical protein n=1 Tax=unclassified Bradyrhizobium TaxID=2631580 RepID=UPI00104AA297|nr:MULTISPECIES: hypothetical protein [unclassified Bradyrhizobium]
MIFQLTSNFENDRTFGNHRRAGMTIMKLQCASLRLALRMMPPASVVKTPPQERPNAANDNEAIWPLVPFPPGWHASS